MINCVSAVVTNSFYYLILKGVESFLHKDVSFVVTGSQEFLKQQKCTDSKVATEGTSEEAQRSTLMRKFAVNNDKHGPGTARAMVLSIIL